jgi:uncharacterized protein YciI
MKYIYRPIILVLAVAGLLFTASAQTASTPPEYDAELAKKLGADDYGMKSYVFCILKTGPKDAGITDKKQRDKIFAGHMANMNRLAKEGKLALAGPFGKNDRAYRGIFIFNVATVEEALKLVETDPVIESGMMIAELTPWYGSAATVLINDLHEKVAKKSF